MSAILYVHNWLLIDNVEFFLDKLVILIIKTNYFISENGLFIFCSWYSVVDLRL